MAFFEGWGFLSPRRPHGAAVRDGLYDNLIASAELQVKNAVGECKRASHDLEKVKQDFDRYNGDLKGNTQKKWFYELQKEMTQYSKQRKERLKPFKAALDTAKERMNDAYAEYKNVCKAAGQTAKSLKQFGLKSIVLFAVSWKLLDMVSSSFRGADKNSV